MPRNIPIQVRRGTAAQWASANPVLAAGEPGFSTDKCSLKIGDGITSYSNLPDYRNGKFANIVTISKTDKLADFVCSDAVYEGSDAACIQAAIDLAAANNIYTIFLTSSAYTIDGIVLLDGVSNLSIIGESGTILTRNYTGAVATYNVHTFDIQKCTNIQIKNIKFAQSDVCTGEIINITGSDRVTVKNCDFDECISAIQMIADATDFTKCTNATIYDNHIARYSYCGIAIGNGCEHIRITKNTIHDGINPNGTLLYAIASATMGSQVRSLPGFNDIQIANNTIYNHGEHNSIDLHGGNNCSVINNHISNVVGTALYVHNNSHGLADPLPPEDVEAHRWTVSGNIIDTTGSGIIITSDYAASKISGIDVSHNTISNISTLGIGIIAVATSSAKNITVAHNTVTTLLGSYANSYAFQCGNAAADYTIQNISFVDNKVDGTENTTPFDNSFRIYGDNNVNVSQNSIFDGGQLYIVDKSTGVVGSGITNVSENQIYCTNADMFGIRADDLAASFTASIHNNTINGCSRGVYAHCTRETSDTSIVENILKSCTTPIYKYMPSGGAPTIKRNTGYVTENTGTATITASQTTVVVTHGLAVAPTRVQLTPTTSTAGKQYYVSAKAATTFTITIESAHSADISFDWSAVV